MRLVHGQRSWLSRILMHPTPSCVRRIVSGPRSVDGRDSFSRWFDHGAPQRAALAAAILFCADPLQVVDAGFALTFGATLGILVGMSTFGDLLPASPWLRAPAALLVASVCAEIALLPIGAFVFSRITFAGLIVNFVAIPLMTLVQIAGMAAVGLTWLSPELARWAGWIAHVAVEGLIGSAALVELAGSRVARASAAPLGDGHYYASLIGVVSASFVVPTSSRPAAIGGTCRSHPLGIVATNTSTNRNH